MFFVDKERVGTYNFVPVITNSEFPVAFVTIPLSQQVNVILISQFIKVSLSVLQKLFKHINNIEIFLSLLPFEAVTQLNLFLDLYNSGFAKLTAGSSLSY